MENFKCNGCDRSVDSPLEIFTGNLICPFCGKTITTNVFEINEYNNDLYEKAEMYYGRYLTLCSQKNDHNSEKEIKQTLQEAIRLCRDASRKGHPGAQVLLGDFWQFGYMQRGSDTYRHKIALHYYKNVTTGDLNQTQNVVGKDYPSKIQKKAKERLGVLNGKSDTTNTGISKDYKKTLKRTFEAIKNKEHCPVFGYFIIPTNEFINLWTEIDPAYDNKPFLKWLDKKYLQSTFCHYAPLQVQKNPVDIENLSPLHNPLANNESIPKIINQSSSVLLYFFNPCPYIPKQLRKSLKKLLPEFSKQLNPEEKNGTNVIEMLNVFLTDDNKDHVFYPEDLFFAIKNVDPDIKIRDGFVKNAIGVLLNHIRLKETQ